MPESLCDKCGGLTKLDLGKCYSLAALPESLGQLQALTTVFLYGCRSLAALPKSLGQLRALTKLDLIFCESLSGELNKRGKHLLKCNEVIRDSRALRYFLMTPTTLQPPSSSARCSGPARDAMAPMLMLLLLRCDCLGAFLDCVLSKLNSDGPAFASIIKRLIAGYCGVYYEAALAGWVAEIESQITDEEVAAAVFHWAGGLLVACTSVRRCSWAPTNYPSQGRAILLAVRMAVRTTRTGGAKN